MPDDNMEPITDRAQQIGTLLGYAGREIWCRRGSGVTGAGDLFGARFGIARFQLFAGHRIHAVEDLAAARFGRPRDEVHA